MPVRCSFEGYTFSRFCVAVYGSILMPFSAFFSEGIVFSGGLDSSYFVARFRHKFHRIAIKNFEKSAEKFVCTTSYR